MNTVINFLKNILSINSHETYIGLSQFSASEETMVERPQARRKQKEMTLSELLRKG